MNKKIKNLFLAGALVLGFAGVAVSCTDYDDDINKLKEENSKLASTIKDLQSKIDAGCVITGVTATNDGLVITTSDGKTYTITNGKDGAKGDKGEPGAPGAPGAPGKDGKDGGFYMPNADGFWYYYESKDAEGVKTDLTVFPVGTITAELKDGKLILHNVKNAKGEYEDFEFDLEKALSSLVFVPQCYVDGVEGMKFVSMRYNALSGKNADSKTEEWSAGNTTTHINPEFEAEYHVNSADVKLDETYTYSFVKKDVPYISTRANASKDFDVVPTFKSFKDGILTVSVAVTGTEANENLISVVALRAQKKDVVVVSDYATLFRGEFGAPVIAWPQAISEKAKNINKKDAHFRRYIATVDADAFLKNQIVWSEGHTTLDEAHATCDTAVVYNESLDLKSIVAAHALNGDKCLEFKNEELKEFGLDWKFELVKNYKIGTPVTDQADFATIENGMFTPKVFSTDGQASIGRTPIVRVSLLNGEKVVAVAYIKIFIKSPADVELPPFELKPVDKNGKNVFSFSCADGVSVLTTTVEDMNVKLYNEMKLSKDQFHALYNKFEEKAGANDKENVGHTADKVNNETEATHVIEWQLTEDEIFALKAGETVTHICKYYSEANPKLAVRIKLTATVADLAAFRTYNITTNEYIDEYWNSDHTLTYYNVNVPEFEENDPAGCLFENNINASFVTENGRVKLTNTDIKGLEYFFCGKDMPKDFKVDGKLVKFEVKGNGDTELYASIGGGVSELIAEIQNDNSEPPYELFTYNKRSEVAKILLNTGNMIVKIGAKGYICDQVHEGREISITFNGKDHFDALVVQPVYVGEKSTDNFEDGVDFGEDGSYVDIADIIDPYDWRGRYFSKYANYWGYYGPFEVEFDLETAECDLNGTYAAVPETIILTQCPAGNQIFADHPQGTGHIKTATLPAEKASAHGFLTYLNNGTVVTKDFNIKIKADVKYGWGVIKTKWIIIPVKKTATNN